MKIIAFILATYISLLTVQPVAEQIYASFTHKEKVCTMACCKNKHARDNKEDANNCCNKGVCNPFGMCNCCFIYNQPQTTIAFNNVALSNKLVPSTENNFISTFLSDCFHPPEIA